MAVPQQQDVNECMAVAAWSLNVEAWMFGILSIKAGRKFRIDINFSLNLVQTTLDQ